MTADDASDLVWYFGAATADCGVRSTCGEQLDRARDLCHPRALIGVSWTGQIHVRSRKPSASPHDTEMSANALAAARRANGIARRLRRLTLRQASVLEAQYAQSNSPDGCVSLALACLQPMAVAGHVAFCRAAMSDSNPVTRMAKMRHLSSCSVWLAHVYRLSGASDFHRKLLDDILRSALCELQDAQKAYVLSRRR